MTKEQKFYKALQDVFIGAKIEGEGGFINLMKIKSGYYSQIEKLLKQDIDKAIEKYPAFREELFDKLHSFFSRYFTDSGSIYFNSTPFHNNIYEKVYTDEKDVILFWKTQMLYYVKTDRIFRSMPIEFDGLKFYFDADLIENKKNGKRDSIKFHFDASQVEGKKANEKRSLVFEIKQVRTDGTVVFAVKHSERGLTTKIDEIVTELKKKNIKVSDEILKRAFGIFEKQSEVDFFINKNARAFLQEQFKLWSYQYFWDGAKEWGADRVNQLQILKSIAFKTIDFISQFEDELVRIWNKPKFVRNANYVITLDRIKDKKLVDKIKKHKNYQQQIKEWKELGIDKNSPKAPIDTKFFKDIEPEILGLFDDLDNSLDGWLIKSENHQALTTILPKFKGRGQTIYLDPPFNTGNDFIFLDNFQDSTWLSLMNDRLELAKAMLDDKGNLYLHLDHLAEHYSKILLDKVLGSENFKAKITWNTGDNISGFKSQALNWIRQADFIHYYTKTDQNIFHKAFEALKKEDSLGWLDFIGKKSNEIFIEKWKGGKFVRQEVNARVKAKGTIWNDIYSFQYSEPRITESLSFVSNQKPENLLRRIIQTSSEIGGFVFDFFAGSGTTCAVAQKLNRKWLGVEMGDYFKEIYLDEAEIKKSANESENEGEEKIGLDNPAIVEVISETDKTAKVIIKKIGLLGRMKIVLNGDKEFKAIHSPVLRKPHLSRDVNWEGGGFFKYYELEQYEDALAKCKYQDSDLFSKSSEKAYQDYVFMKDEKMLSALEIDYKKNKVKVDLSKLYPDIDIAETISNLTGKWIKAIKGNKVEFSDGSEIDTSDLDYKLIKPLIWW